MRIELRDKPEEKKEPVAKVWLEQSGPTVTLCYAVDGDLGQSIAYFDDDDNTFVVFEDDLHSLNYTLQQI